jgi:hypothetical protein
MRIILMVAAAALATSTYMQAVDVSLTVRNRGKTAKTGDPVTSGIPFAKGVLKSESQVRLLREGAEVDAQFMPAARWPDGSIRWLLVDFQADLPASGSASFTLRTGAAHAAYPGISIDDRENQLTIRTRSATFTFQKSEFALRGCFFEVRSGGVTHRAVPFASKGWTIEERGPMKVVVRVTGTWKPQLANALDRFMARLVFFRDKAYLRTFLTFRNNNSYGWDQWSEPGEPELTISSARFGGAVLLKDGSDYIFGSGVEKTWELYAGSGKPAEVDSRYKGDGRLAPGYSYPHPLAACTPEYYASTGAFGRIALPVSRAAAGAQPDFDLFEKLQRAKVIDADVEDPPGVQGYTLWQHLYQDIRSWHDYGDLRWGGDYGPISGNHYDWPYGMYLHFMRTGRLEFADAARVFARHEIDMDLYHTGADGTAYNYQKNWESRPSHDGPGNVFGCGRPSHTWMQGYALHWLLTGDPRGMDACDELGEGLRQYVYESFNGEGYIDTSEIRIAGWITDNLIVLHRLNPKAVMKTTFYGEKTIPEAIKDVLQAVLDRERQAGGHGYVNANDPPDPNQQQPLQHLYIIEPLIKAYSEVFKGSDPAYASRLLGLIKRMTGWLMSVTYGGDTNEQGLYRPRQIPYWIDRSHPEQREGQIPYLLMAANAAGFCWLETGQDPYRGYARRAFQDYIRYLGVTPGDAYVNPSERTPTSYNSTVYVDTESKVHGWSSRYGQYVLDALR